MQDTRGSLFRSWLITLLLLVSACTQILGEFETKPGGGLGPGLDAGGDGAGPLPQQGPIIVNPTSGLVTSEAGRTAQFTIVLKSKPTSNVAIALKSSNTNEGTINRGSVTFSKDSWNVPQTVVVTGVDDNETDGNRPYNIVTSPASSDDPTFKAVDPPDVAVTNIDNESAGFTISPDKGLMTSEWGGEATFTVVLNTPPKANVTIGLSSNDENEGVVSPRMMTFTPQNWRSPQMATVTGVDDVKPDGPKAYKIITSPAVSPGDPNYDKVDPDDVDVINEDDDTAGFTVKPTMGLVTNENGQMATFTVALNFAPTANVVVKLSSSNTNEGVVSPTSLTFTTANWKAPQIVTVSGVQDAVADGDQSFDVITAPAESGDPAYSNLDPPDVSVTNVDDDSAGITVKPAEGLVTTEAGGEATFTIVLNSKPSDDVVIGLSSSLPAEGAVSPASVTFTKSNWNAPQTVTVTGMDDSVADGNQPYLVRTAKAVSKDLDYNDLDGPDVKVSNQDDDSAGFVVMPTMGLVTSEKGDFATFTIALTSRPTADVKIGLTSNNPAEGTVSPASLTFTPDNYRAVQTVTVTGVDDKVEDGNQVYRITTGDAVSTDLGYNGLPVPDVEVTNTDDDSAGITVKLLETPLETSEKLDTAQFTVVLNSQPAPMTTVTIGLSSTNLAEGTVSPGSLVFTGDNWNAPRTVTITGVDDDVQDGNQQYRITIAPATSTDPKYNGLDVPDPVVTNIDNDVAGIKVTAAPMLTTSEKGGTATFTIELNSRPTAAVTIVLTSSLPSEGRVSPSTLTFSTTDWSAPQTVTVTGVDDKIADGNQPYSVITGLATSADPNYSGMNPADVSLINLDDDSPGFIITPTTTLTTSEDGLSATFTVQLQSEPVNDVSVGVHSSDLGEGRTDVMALVFTPANYNAPHTVTVTGVDDSVADRDQTYRIILDAATSADAKYNGLNPIDVTVTNIDNDSPGFTVSAAAGNTREDGTTTTFTVRLTSQPAGTATVTVPLSSSNPNEGVIMQPSLVFTTANWAAPQTVTVRGVDDDVADGNQQYRAILGAASSPADPNYDGLDPPDVVIINVDNDKAGITVGAPSGNTTEAGGTATFTVVLDSQPTADVAIPMSSSNVNEGTVMASSLLFTTLNWMAPQTVTVRGVNDFVADGNQPYKIILGVMSGGDYAGIDPPDVDLINIDDDSPGFIVTPTSGLVTTESGGTDTFTVRLTSEPTANVTIGVHSNDVTEGAANTALLTFTPANYSSPQTVTVRGLDDDVADGSPTYKIILDPAMSTDPNYNGRDPDDVTATNTDNDSAGIAVIPPTNPFTSEKRETTTFTVALTSQPTADVVVPIVSNNTAEGTVSPATITFTTSNWRSPATVTVQGVDDPIPVQDGNQPYLVRVGPVVASADPKYVGLSGPDVHLTNIDNDSAGITVSPTGGLLTGENGDTATFTVVLNSQPSGDVVIPVTSSSTAEGTVLPASLTFTSSNWSSPKTVTVRGVDDPIPTKDGNSPYVIHVGPVTTSADPNYVGKFADISATNVDNDSAGITVSPTSGLLTGENGDTATFTVVLTSLPSGDVTVPISSSDTSEGTVTPSTLTFTTANWSSPRTITVRGVNDPIPVQDGNRPYLVHVGPVAMSADSNYVGATGPDVSVTNIDDDSAGISASVSTISTSEDATSNTFTVVLRSQPSGDVILPISSSNTAEGTVSPSSVTFTSSNWSSPRIITVTGVNDTVPVQDGNQPYTVHVGPVVTSADPNYVGKFVDVAATNIDNDSAGITVSPTSGLTTGENLDTATFTVVLTTQPSGDVTVPISSSDSTEGTVSPTVVTFTPMNWSSPKQITVTGVNDPVPVQDGDKPYRVHVGPIIDTQDPNYAGVAGSDVSLVNIDDDSAGITVSVTSGLTTSEDGTTGTFTVVLHSQPTGTVTVPITSSNTGEGTITSTTPLVFDANNWSSPQNVTVKGVNDSPPVQDGDKPYVIHVGPVTTTGDPNYLNKFADVGAINRDNDSAGFTLTPVPPLPLATGEDGTPAHFTIVLNTQPSGTVTIPVASLLTSEGTVSTGSVSFDGSDWSTPKTITVTGVNDNPPVKDGDKPYVVRVGPISMSGDPNYVGVPAQDVNLTNVDDDSAGISVTPTSGLQTTESGGTATFTVELNSAPAGGTVTVPLTSDTPTEGTVTASVTFTMGDWNVPHLVTVTGQNDMIPVQDGNAPYTITVGPSTATVDPNYVGLMGTPVSVTNLDNDTAAILVSKGALTTSESATSDSFTVVLATLPAGNVTVDVSLPPAGEGTMSVTMMGMNVGPSILFTQSDWSTPRTVTITGVDDNPPVQDGDAIYSIQLGPVTISSDAHYMGKSASVQVTNNDNDMAALDITITSTMPSTCDTTSVAPTVTFSVKLHTYPTDNVTVTIPPLVDPMMGTITGSPMTFTQTGPTAWNVAQMFDVTGGAVGGMYTLSVDPDSASDLNYKNLASWTGSCTNTP